MVEGFYRGLSFLQQYWLKQSFLPECSLGGIIAPRIEVWEWFLLIFALLPLTIDRSRMFVPLFGFSTHGPVYVVRCNCECDSSGWAGVGGLHGVTV